jgi:hypothetical protein
MTEKNGSEAAGRIHEFLLENGIEHLEKNLPKKGDIFPVNCTSL